MRSTWFWTKAWLWFCGVLLVVSQLTASYTDHALVNVVTFACVTLGGLVWMLWFAFFSRRSWQLRLLPWGVVTLGVSLGVLLWEFQHFNGELVPVYKWRFRQKTTPNYAGPTQAPPAVNTTATPSGDDSPTAASNDTPISPSEVIGEFPQFLGPGRRNQVPDVRLATDWKLRPPRVVWKQPIGEGWSGFSVANGRAFTLEQRGEQELVTCYELLTGRLLWMHATPIRHSTVVGGAGPRSTPTIDGSRVYTQGAAGHLFCFDAATGNVVWKRQLLEEFVTGGQPVTATAEEQTVQWGRAASPLVVDDRLFIPAGGPISGPWVSLLALNKGTGETIWKGGEHQISYSSPDVATLAGRRQIVLVVQDFLCGFDWETGRELWRQEWAGNSNSNASNSQAVALPDDLVFVSKAYGTGAMLLRIKPDNDRQKAEVVWRNRTVIKTKYTNVVIKGNLVYGLSDGILECFDMAAQQRQWKNGRFGHGQILGVGDSLLLISEEGELVHVAASRDALVEFGRLQVLEGRTWNNLCLAGRYLLVRNATEAACLELPLAE